MNLLYRKLNRQKSVFLSAHVLLKALYLSTFKVKKMEYVRKELGTGL